MLGSFFDRFIEFIEKVWRFIWPIRVLDDDQRGLIRRFGCYHRPMKLGLNWVAPFMIEEACTCNAAWDSEKFEQQNLTTKDGKAIKIRGVMTYRVIDARKYILEINAPESVINDVGGTVLAEIVPKFTADEVLGIDNEARKGNEKFLLEAARKMRVRAKKWGLEIDSVGLADRVATKNISLHFDHARIVQNSTE